MSDGHSFTDSIEIQVKQQWAPIQDEFPEEDET